MYTQHIGIEINLKNQFLKNKDCVSIGREEINLSLFTDGMIIYVVNPKETTTTTIKGPGNNKCFKPGCKIQGKVPKLIIYLYANNK